MAQRRMFSLKVIDTDNFLDMSPSAQNLYFHLGMRADDDGFVSAPKKIMKMVNASEDDYTVLKVKNFIIPMSTNGVAVITHWKVNNLIKSDRYTETMYKSEKGRIAENDGIYRIDILGSKMVPEVEPQVRLGKDSIGEDTEEPAVSNFTKKPIKASFGEFGLVKLTQEEYQKLIDGMGEKNMNLIIMELDTYIASKGKKYSSHYATILNWARRKVMEHVETKNSVAFA